MERYAWKGRIKEGTKEEYIRRHKEIWPEMKAVLKEAGIANYSIWFTENELFGYYECEKGAAFAAEVQAKSPVVARWDAFMKDILIMEKDPATGRAAPLGRGLLSGIAAAVKTSLRQKMQRTVNAVRRSALFLRVRRKSAGKIQRLFPARCSSQRERCR